MRILKAFQYKHKFLLTLKAFKALRYVFPEISIPSIDVIRTRLKFLSGFNISTYDCCINSCCCFLGSYSEHIICPFCGESRYTADGISARKKFTYSPLIPRLRSYYENRAMCVEMLYRHEYSNTSNSTTRHDGDVFQKVKLALILLVTSNSINTMFTVPPLSLSDIIISTELFICNKFKLITVIRKKTMLNLF